MTIRRPATPSAGRRRWGGPIVGATDPVGYPPWSGRSTPRSSTPPSSMPSGSISATPRRADGRPNSSPSTRHGDRRGVRMSDDLRRVWAAVVGLRLSVRLMRPAVRGRRDGPDQHDRHGVRPVSRGRVPDGLHGSGDRRRYRAEMAEFSSDRTPAPCRGGRARARGIALRSFSRSRWYS